MPRYRLTLEYHGGPFRGWQRQDNGPSVQGAVEAALSRLGEYGATEDAPPLVYGAGRTDAGVHALAQVAHVDLRRVWDPFRLCEALNFHLKPQPVAVRAARVAADDFHARFDATERVYVYRLIARRAPLALDHGLAWRRPKPLDLGAMREAAAHLVGRHDFTTFRSAQCQAQTPVKTLDALDVAVLEGPCTPMEGWEREFRITARARSFLHNQVRSLVGTLERVGAGAWAPARVADALAAADRSACGPVAPPDGLYLQRVVYPGDVGSRAKASG
ncbi:MAG: tRNA pseudouridine(38-40) synthase TruA [Pseudomonadota bacterium]